MGLLSRGLVNDGMVGHEKSETMTEFLSDYLKAGPFQMI